ncbi:alanine racemase [Microbacterium alcoholitolerans]|uniref:alanine racemase n=1 Tax=unclassified Microbacterium TaxID=2609290 RepID=UPI003D1714C0
MTALPSLALTKGLGPSLAGGDAAALVGTSLFAADRDFPQLALSRSAIAHNIAAMMAYARERGVAIAPHGKTAMSPTLAQQQLDAGAWGITAATPTQLRVYRDAGISRLVLANQLVEPGAIAWLRRELDADPEFECVVYADSADGLDLLAGNSAGRPIDVLLEAGNPGGRTGVRGAVALRALAERAARTSGIRVVGTAAYEGTIGGATDAEKIEHILAFSRQLSETTLALESDGLLAGGLISEGAIVSIGGSAYFDVAIDGLLHGGLPPERILLRSGAYLTHDDGLYERTTPSSRGNASAPSLQAAIRVWAPVLSIPEPGLAIVLCGRRDVGFDQDLPVVQGVRGRDGSAPRDFAGRVTKLADQHAFIGFDAEATAPRVGELVELGISHPCTTLDRWGLVPVVDDDHAVRDVVRLHFT